MRIKMRTLPMDCLRLHYLPMMEGEEVLGIWKVLSEDAYGHVEDFEFREGL